MRRRWTQLQRSLEAQEPKTRFAEEAVEDLPEPARRYLLHSIAPGSRVARSVRLETFFRMKLRESDPKPVDVQGEGLLAPPLGFVWRARAKMGLLPVRVQDHYAQGSGGVEVDLLGIIPVVRAAGPDVTRSARGRLAAEASLFEVVSAVFD